MMFLICYFLGHEPPKGVKKREAMWFQCQRCKKFVLVSQRSIKDETKTKKESSND